MQLFTKFLALLPLVSFASSATLSKRQDTAEYCGQWDTVIADPYTLYLNQWGMENADSGSACANIVSLSGNTISWNNDWTWTGGDGGVKSYTNVNLNEGIGGQLSSISSIPVTWEWSQTISSDAVANIAFDLFTSSSATGTNEYEIMVWVANINAGPISYTYDASGSPTPVAAGVEIGGITWDVFYGTNGANYVYSFLTSDGSTLNSFSGDLNDYLSYLSTEQDLSPTQYLTTVQAGTEATEGSAEFSTSSYSVSVE